MLVNTSKRQDTTNEVREFKKKRGINNTNLFGISFGKWEQ